MVTQTRQEEAMLLTTICPITRTPASTKWSGKSTSGNGMSTNQQPSSDHHHDSFSTQATAPLDSSISTSTWSVGGALDDHHHNCVAAGGGSSVTHTDMSQLSHHRERQDPSSNHGIAATELDGSKSSIYEEIVISESSNSTTTTATTSAAPPKPRCSVANNRLPEAAARRWRLEKPKSKNRVVATIHAGDSSSKDNAAPNGSRYPDLVSAKTKNSTRPVSSWLLQKQQSCPHFAMAGRSATTVEHALREEEEAEDTTVSSSSPPPAQRAISSLSGGTGSSVTQAGEQTERIASQQQEEQQAKNHADNSNAGQEVEGGSRSSTPASSSNLKARILAFQGSGRPTPGQVVVGAKSTKNALMWSRSSCINLGRQHATKERKKPLTSAVKDTVSAENGDGDAKTPASSTAHDKDEEEALETSSHRKEGGRMMVASDVAEKVEEELQLLESCSTHSFADESSSSSSSGLTLQIKESSASDITFAEDASTQQHSAPPCQNQRVVTSATSSSIKGRIHAFRGSGTPTPANNKNIVEYPTWAKKKSSPVIQDQESAVVKTAAEKETSKAAPVVGKFSREKTAVIQDHHLGNSDDAPDDKPPCAQKYQVAASRSTAVKPTTRSSTSNNSLSRGSWHGPWQGLPKTTDENISTRRWSRRASEHTPRGGVTEPFAVVGNQSDNKSAVHSTPVVEDNDKDVDISSRSSHKTTVDHDHEGGLPTEATNNDQPRPKHQVKPPMATFRTGFKPTARNSLSHSTWHGSWQGLPKQVTTEDTPTNNKGKWSSRRASVNYTPGGGVSRKNEESSTVVVDASAQNGTRAAPAVVDKFCSSKSAHRENGRTDAPSDKASSSPREKKNHRPTPTPMATFRGSFIKPSPAGTAPSNSLSHYSWHGSWGGIPKTSTTTENKTNNGRLSLGAPAGGVTKDDVQSSTDAASVIAGSSVQNSAPTLTSSQRHVASNVPSAEARPEWEEHSDAKSTISRGTKGRADRRQAGSAQPYPSFDKVRRVAQPTPTSANNNNKPWQMLTPLDRQQQAIAQSRYHRRKSDGMVAVKQSEEDEHQQQESKIGRLKKSFTTTGAAVPVSQKMFVPGTTASKDDEFSPALNEMPEGNKSSIVSCKPFSGLSSDRTATDELPNDIVPAEPDFGKDDSSRQPNTTNDSNPPTDAKHAPGNTTLPTTASAGKESLGSSPTETQDDGTSNTAVANSTRRQQQGSARPYPSFDKVRRPARPAGGGASASNMTWQMLTPMDRQQQQIAQRRHHHQHRRNSDGMAEIRKQQHQNNFKRMSETFSGLSMNKNGIASDDSSFAAPSAPQEGRTADHTTADSDSENKVACSEHPAARTSVQPQETSSMSSGATRGNVATTEQGHSTPQVEREVDVGECGQSKVDLPNDSDRDDPEDRVPAKVDGDLFGQFHSPTTPTSGTSRKELARSEKHEKRQESRKSRRQDMYPSFGNVPRVTPSSGENKKWRVLTPLDQQQRAIALARQQRRGASGVVSAVPAPMISSAGRDRVADEERELAAANARERKFQEMYPSFEKTGRADQSASTGAQQPVTTPQQESSRTEYPASNIKNDSRSIMPTEQSSSETKDRDSSSSHVGEEGSQSDERAEVPETSKQSREVKLREMYPSFESASRAGRSGAAAANWRVLTPLDQQQQEIARQRQLRQMSRTSGGGGQSETKARPFSDLFPDVSSTNSPADRSRSVLARTESHSSEPGEGSSEQGGEYTNKTPSPKRSPARKSGGVRAQAYPSFDSLKAPGGKSKASTKWRVMTPFDQQQQEIARRRQERRKG